MEKQFRQLPYWTMTVKISAVDGLFSRGLAKEVFKLIKEITS